MNYLKKLKELEERVDRDNNQAWLIRQFHPDGTLYTISGKPVDPDLAHPEEFTFDVNYIEDW